MMKPRILIVDDHEIVREGIRILLNRLRPEWEICGEASNGKEAIQAVQSLNPDLLLLDVTMPVLSEPRRPRASESSAFPALS